MIVYLDGMDFRRTGIGRVFENLLSGLAASERVSLVQAVVPGDRSKEFLAAYAGNPKIAPLFSGFGPFTTGDFLEKQRLIDAFSPRADVCLYPNMNVPLFPRGRIVFTINDVVMISKASSWGFPKRFLFRHLSSRAFRLARGVVYISRFTEREAEGVFGKPGIPVRVIYPCLGDDFHGADPARYREIPLVAGDYVLHVGVRIPHKNQEGLICGWMEARKKVPGLRLVVAGRRLREDDEVDRLRRRHALGDQLVELLSPSDEELKNLYANAKAFVFPSRYEGFGIPPLEAIAMGAPVVCGDIPVLREVNGDSAEYVDPDDPEDIGRGIVRVLTESGVRERLLLAGRARLPYFTAERMAGEYIDFLEACRG